MVPKALLWGGLVQLAVTTPGTTQEVAVPASAYALVNARILVAPGNVIERGTVVLRDGRIEEVGPEIAAPSDAIRLDLDGYTVYPGMVEAASSLGLPRIGGGRGRGGGRPPAADEGPGPALRPFRMAVEAFDRSEEHLETLRKAGVTTVGLAFQGGLFPGQTGAMSTGDGPRASQILRTPISMQVAFGSTRGYPRTLMGALAYIEQSWEDTSYDMRVQASFETDPASSPRPQFDREHEALIPAVRGTMPVWFSASRQRDFTRVADLAARLGVTDYVFLGGQEGYLATELLADLGRPVIVSLDFPNPNQVTGRAFDYHVAPVAGDDVADEAADSATAQATRRNAATLVDVGVRIALSSFGASVSDFRSLVGSAIEAGLSADEALRAVTATPAELLGLDGAIGTIERGKLANLLVTDGDLFDDDTHILHVFVEGQLFDYTPQSDGEDDENGRNRRRGGGR